MKKIMILIAVLAMTVGCNKKDSTVKVETPTAVDTIKTEPINYVEKCDDYLRFSPTNEFTADDIAYTRIPNGDFKPDTSCHAVSLFKSIFDKYGSKINASTLFTFTKGKKIITMPDGKRKIVTTVMFFIKFTDGTIGYFDIADDPTSRII